MLYISSSALTFSVCNLQMFTAAYCFFPNVFQVFWSSDNRVLIFGTVRDCNSCDLSKQHLLTSVGLNIEYCFSGNGPFKYAYKYASKQLKFDRLRIPALKLDHRFGQPLSNAGVFARFLDIGAFNTLFQLSRCLSFRIFHLCVSFCLLIQKRCSVTFKYILNATLCIHLPVISNICCSTWCYTVLSQPLVHYAFVPNNKERFDIKT